MILLIRFAYVLKYGGIMVRIGFAIDSNATECQTGPPFHKSVSSTIKIHLVNRRAFLICPKNAASLDHNVSQNRPSLLEHQS